MKKLRVALLVAAMAALYSCTTLYDKNFEEANKIASAGDAHEAYARFAKLCQEKPDSDSCKRRDDMKGLIANGVFGRIKTSLEQDMVDGYVPLDVIDKLNREAMGLMNYGLSRMSLVEITGKIEAEKARTTSGVNGLLDEAASLVKEKKMLKAFENYTTAAKYDPKTKSELDSHATQLINALAAEAARATDQEDWKDAVGIYGEIQAINPGYPNIFLIYNDAKSKDSLEYHMKQADEAIKKDNFERAIKMYKIAGKYEKGEAAKQLIIKTKILAAQFYYKKGQKAYEDALSHQAYMMFLKADEYFREVPFKDQSLVQKPTKVINQFVDALSSSVTKEEEKGNYGLSYQLLKIIAAVEPNFPGIKNRLTASSDRLAQRAIKGLAVIPFKSPAYSPEAGKIFSSNIIFYLHKNLRPDIKVVEREAIETIIKESELKHAGDDKGRDSSLNISGVDYFLLGDVLDYKIETSNRDVQKSVRAQTRTERVRNSDYDAWLITKDRLGDKAPQAPPSNIDKPVIEEVRYKITYYKKVAMADISYKVVDIKGKIINANVIKFKEEAASEGTDGVDAGDFKVPVKFAEVPSDIELMGKVQEQAIAKIGEELKSMLGNPEKRYMDEAIKLEKDGNVRESIERYSDAEVIYSKKGIDAKDITAKYGKLLDSITGI